MMTSSYAVRHKDIQRRLTSQSGGLFVLLSDCILAEGGVVYGVSFDVDRREACFMRAETAEERDRMRGSKYIQALVGNCFKQVKEDLTAGRKVLFSGTACQVRGLKSFVGNPDNLITVDIVCHGVPSPKVFKDYVLYQEKKNGGRCIAFDFRNKRKFGWHSHVETLTLQKDSGSVISVDSDIWATIFYKHDILRPACYVCPYKSTERISDISIADFWGIERNAPELDDNKGVSLALVSSTKGEALFKSASEYMDCVQTVLENSLQPPLKAPFPRPAKRDEFWIIYDDNGLESVIVRMQVRRKLSKIKSLVLKPIRVAKRMIPKS